RNDRSILESKPPHPWPLSPKGERGVVSTSVALSPWVERGALFRFLLLSPPARRGGHCFDFCCPLPLGGEGGPRPALSPAGAGRVRGLFSDRCIWSFRHDS